MGERAQLVGHRVAEPLKRIGPLRARLEQDDLVDLRDAGLQEQIEGRRAGIAQAEAQPPGGGAVAEVERQALRGAEPRSLGHAADLLQAELAARVFEEIHVVVE
jgi:hypothetical protein